MTSRFLWKQHTLQSSGSNPKRQDFSKDTFSDGYIPAYAYINAGRRSIVFGHAVERVAVRDRLGSTLSI